MLMHKKAKMNAVSLNSVARVFGILWVSPSDFFKCFAMFPGILKFLTVSLNHLRLDYLYVLSLKGEQQIERHFYKATAFSN